jgi:hypothetical protein
MRQVHGQRSCFVGYHMSIYVFAVAHRLLTFSAVQVEWTQ